jgi:hypothetical protein
MPVTTGRVFNLSFGRVLSTPIQFDFNVPSPAFSARITINLMNDDALYNNEKQLLSYHTLLNRQSLGYNPYAAAQTGIIRATYPDHPKHASYGFNETAKDLLYRDISYFFSFIQRRRVLFTNLSFVPSSGVVSLPIQAAGEYMDAVAEGPLLITESEVQAAIQNFIRWSESASLVRIQEMRGVLVRMNNMLNLPYAYERAEGYWRVLEALGTKMNDSPASLSLYASVKACIGMKKDSGNLKSTIRAITSVSSGDVGQIAKCHKFRNEITHEFVEFNMLSGGDAPDAMSYLMKMCERFVARTIGIPESSLSEPTYNHVFGRVM